MPNISKATTETRMHTKRTRPIHIDPVTAACARGGLAAMGYPVGGAS